MQSEIMKNPYQDAPRYRVTRVDDWSEKHTYISFMFRIKFLVLITGPAGVKPVKQEDLESIKDKGVSGDSQVRRDHRGS